MEQEQILYKLELDDSQLEAQLNKTTSSLIKSDAAVKQLNASLKQTENEIAQLDKELQENGKLTAEQAARLQQLRQSQIQQTQALVQQRSESSRLRGEQNNLLKQYTNLEGSNNRLRGQLSVLTTQYNALSREQRLNTKEGLQLQKQIKSISDELKRNEGAVGDNRRNVGNYAQSIREAIAGSGKFGSALGGLGTALKANPIGLLVTALTFVVSLFRQSQPVLDFFERKIGAIQNVVGVLIERAGTLGKAFGLLLEGKFSEAADTAASAFNNLGAAIKDAAVAGDAFVEAQQALDDLLVKNEVSASKNNAQIAKLNAQLRDRTKTEAQRLAIADEITKLERQQFALETKAGNEALRIAREKLKEALRQKGVSADQINDTEKLLDLAFKAEIRDEKFLALKDAQIAVNNRLAESNALLERTESRKNAIIQQGNEERQRQQQQAQAAIEKEKKSLDDLATFLSKTYEAELQTSIKAIDQTFKDQSDNIKLLRAEQLTANQTALAQGVISAEQAAKNEFEINQRFDDLETQNKVNQLNTEILELEKYASTVEGIEQLIAERQVSLANLTTEQKLANYQKEYIRQKQLADQALKEEQARQQAFQQAVTSQLQGVAQASQQLANDLINNQQAVFATFSKNVLTSTLDVIERVLIAESVAAIGVAKIKDIALFGPAGLITAAIKIAGISAAFGIAKAGVQSALSFNTGGVVPQSGNGRLNRGGDNTLALVKSGEVIANDAQQSRIEAIAGPDIWARAGIPGFNAGGFVPPAPADIPTPAIDLSSANLVVSVRDIDTQLASVRVTQSRRTL